MRREALEYALRNALAGAPPATICDGPLLATVVSSEAGADGQIVRCRTYRGRGRAGDRLVLLPSQERVGLRVVLPTKASTHPPEHLDTFEIDRPLARPGDVLACSSQPPDCADHMATDVLWTGVEPMLPGRTYLMECAGQHASASVTTLKYRHETDGENHIAANQLAAGEIGFCNLSLSQSIAYETHPDDSPFATFRLRDRRSGEVVGAGVFRFALRRSANVKWQALSLDKGARGAAKSQVPACLWLTGFSGSGKSTLANLLENRLHSLGRHCYILDGDNVRHGLNRDLGFTDADRVENIRRVAEVAKLMVDSGLIVLVSFISPFRAERQMARELFDPGEFIEIFVDTPLEVCEQRDPKGLYRRARAGQIKNFTGLDSPYESPEAPEVHLETVASSPDEMVKSIIAHLTQTPKLKPL